MRNTLLLILLFPTLLWAQRYDYKINLADCKKDRISVALTCPAQQQDTAYFQFPMTVPGTYDIQNYGTYIVDFKAYDAQQNPLKVKKLGANTFQIFPARQLSRITYGVNDTWDSKEKKHKVFEPTGTGFEKDAYFYINNGGLFGFFDGMLKLPYHLEFSKPAALIGYSSMPTSSEGNTVQRFQATDYHQLIDSPILFTGQPSEHLQVANAQITIASFYATDDSSAVRIKGKLEACLKAIEAFLGKDLPVQNYAFLNYIVDYRDIGEILMRDHVGIFQYLKIGRRVGGQAFGALEHGASSSYYLPDFTHDSYVGTIRETAIHEFMHIYAPLSLHSDRIGDFDYVHPKMSQHLWLYEGVTEYFATLIGMQGKLETVDEMLQHTLKEKIVNAARYPDSIPFTVMSENVFVEPYHKLYDQVYERGAIMAMLLDFEIMRLTQGKKTLKDIVFELVAQYGKDRSFAESEIIPQFVKHVHPDLQRFFDRYVTGTTPLDLTGGFKIVGIDYQVEKSGTVPIDLISKEDNGVEANVNVVINNRITIKKTAPGNLGGFLAGDKVDRDEVYNCFKNAAGEYVPEGEMITLSVLREGKPVELKFAAKYKQGTLKNVIEINKNPSAEQARLFQLWTTGRGE